MRVLTDELDCSTSVLGACRSRLRVPLGRDEIADLEWLLQGGQRCRETCIDSGHHRFEHGLVGFRGLHPILEYEGREAESCEPAGNVDAFVGPRIDRPTAPGNDDHTDAV